MPEHHVRTARQMGWADLDNGELLVRVSQHFEVFLTTDKNLRYQQNLDQLPVSVLELNTIKTRLKDLAELGPSLPEALELTKRFRFVSLHSDGHIETRSERLPE